LITRSFIVSFILSMFILASLQSVSAQPGEFYLEIPAIADSYVAEDKSSWKAGLEDYLIIGFSEYLSQYDCEVVVIYEQGRPVGKGIQCSQRYLVRDRRNILVHFDLGQIPPGSEITEAILQLHIYTSLDSLPVVVYGLEECFEEEEVTWVSRNAGNRWRDSGGTHEKTVLDKGTLGKFQKSTGFYRFNVTDYYRRVMKGEIRNCGVLIAPDPKRYPGPRKEIVSEKYYGGGAAEAKKYEFLKKRAGYYAKFYSRELAQKDNLPEYIPVLMIKFRGPSIHLTPDQLGSLNLSPGEETSFNLMIEGTYLGDLTLVPEVSGEGINVSIDGTPSMGSSVKVLVSVGKDAEPGEYELRIRPEVSGYNISYFDVIESSAKITVERKTSEPYKDFLMMPEYLKVNVSRGASTSFKLNLVPRGKFWAKVYLTATGPDWMKVSFDPEEGVPGFSSVVHVEAPGDAPPGIYDLVLNAEGGNVSKNLTIKVRVLEAQATQETTQTGTSSFAQTTTMGEKTTSPLAPQSTPYTTSTVVVTAVKSEGGINPLLLLAPILIALAAAAVILFRRKAG